MRTDLFAHWATTPATASAASFVHYTSGEEVERLIGALQRPLA
jgi:selenocysteine lyase/cysteine desulfurase